MKLLVTGGAGFIGANFVVRTLTQIGGRHHGSGCRQPQERVFADAPVDSELQAPTVSAAVPARVARKHGTARQGERVAPSGLDAWKDCCVYLWEMRTASGKYSRSCDWKARLVEGAPSISTIING